MFLKRKEASMTVYELVNETINIDNFTLHGDSFPTKAKEKLDSDEDKRIYDLIRNVASIYAEISDKGVKFQPSIVWEGKRSFGVQDISDNDYEILMTLDLDKLPLNVRAKFADILWNEKKNYQKALVAIDAYIGLFCQWYSDESYIDSLNMIRRAIYISAQINKKEKHDEACELVYKHVIRIDAKDKNFLSLSLIGILIKEKYGDVDAIISILDKIIMNFENNVRKIERAYELKEESLRWKKDTDSIVPVRISLAHYYEKKAIDLKKDNFQSLMTAVKYLQKAIFIYRNNGESKHGEIIQKKMVEWQGKLPKMIEPITTTYDVSKLQDFLLRSFEGLSFPECILRMNQFTLFRKKNTVKDLVISDLQEYPFSNLFSDSFMNTTGQTVLNLRPLNKNNPEDDKLLLDAYIQKKLFDLEEVEGNFYLKRCLDIIRQMHSFQVDDINFLVENNPLIPIGRERIFKSAIFMVLQGQYYEALHILAPQMENFFRNLAKEVGALTITLDDDGTSKAKVLSTVFDLPELIESYDNDILFCFKGMLNEQVGANIRNKIGHGLLSEREANDGASIYFMCSVIKLLSFTSQKCYDIYSRCDKLKTLEQPKGSLIMAL